MAKLRSTPSGGRAVHTLPTAATALLWVTDFRDSIIAALGTRRGEGELHLYMYAVTQSGWNEIRAAVKKWLSAPSRSARAYVGTDHGLTDPDALRQLGADGISVYLVTDYVGVYHPKVVRLVEPDCELLWAGSNNLTTEGLRFNIEFATLSEFASAPPPLQAWASEVHDASVPATRLLIDEYEQERKKHTQALVQVGSFTWTRRTRPPARRRRPSMRAKRAVRPALLRRGDLVVEVMPRETGAEGKQLQLPKQIAISFFRLPARVGSTITVRLRNELTGVPRDLTLSLFSNYTTRLSIRELEYGDRPCVILFRREAGEYRFAIISRAIFPRLYTHLISRAAQQTRAGSRHWGIL